MGWRFKGFLGLTALILFGAGLWWVSAIIVAYLLLSLRPRRKAGRTAVATPRGEDPGAPTAGDGRGPRAGVEWRWRYLLGGLFVIGALLGVAEHGVFSPLVFGALGALCFLWGPTLGRLVPFANFSPLEESTLLRRVILPFEWLTVVELKMSSQESARALSVLHDDLVVVVPSVQKPAAYLMVKETAVGYRRAEARMAERLRTLTGLLASRGVYAMPLDSLEAARRFGQRLEAVRMDPREGTILESVGHSHYDVLAVRPVGAHAESVGAYRVVSPSGEGEANQVGGRPRGAGAEASPSKNVAMPAASRPFARPPLLWEVVSSLLERFHLADPDGYTVFLNNMHLSRGVPPGEKMDVATGGEAAKVSNGSTLMVESLGGAPVELTRAQLRTIVKMYD